MTNNDLWVALGTVLGFPLALMAVVTISQSANQYINGAVTICLGLFMFWLLMAGIQVALYIFVRRL